LEQIYQNVFRVGIKVININSVLVENFLASKLSNSSLYYVAVLSENKSDVVEN